MRKGTALRAAASSVINYLQSFGPYGEVDNSTWRLMRYFDGDPIKFNFGQRMNAKLFVPTVAVLAAAWAGYSPPSVGYALRATRYAPHLPPLVTVTER